MSNSFVQAVTLTICAILVVVQFFRWMSTEHRKRRTLMWSVGLALVCLSQRVLFFDDQPPNDLQQTHGTLKSTQYRYYNLGRTSTNRRVEIRLEGHETVFEYRGPDQKLDSVLRIQAVPITITHRAGSSVVWGIDLSGAVIDSPQERIERDREYANLSALAGLGVLLLAFLIGRYVRVSPDSPDKTAVDDESLVRQRTATGAAPPAVTSITDPGAELPGSPKAGATFRVAHTATSAASASSAEKWTPGWLVVQVFVLPASILFGIVVTRWVWATQLPKGDLGYGGFLFVLLGMFLFLALAGVAHGVLTLAALRLHYLPRLCLLVGVLSATYYGFQIQERVEPDRPPVRTQKAPAAATTREAAMRQEMDLGLEPTRRPELPAPQSSPHLQESVDKVLDHAPPGTVPPMLEMNRESGAMRVVNHATHFVDLRMASVHNPSGTWERCHWLAPITASRFSPTDVSVRLNAGESRLFNLDETCQDRFSDGALEFVVRDGKGTVLFKSDSAFYP